MANIIFLFAFCILATSSLLDFSKLSISNIKSQICETLERIEELDRFFANVDGYHVDVHEFEAKEGEYDSKFHLLESYRSKAASIGYNVVYDEKTCEDPTYFGTFDQSLQDLVVDICKANQVLTELYYAYSNLDLQDSSHHEHRNLLNKIEAINNKKYGLLRKYEKIMGSRKISCGFHTMFD